MQTTNFNDLRDAVGEWATNKGWNDRKVTVGEDLMLMVSELSEALEEFRKGYHPSHYYFDAVEGSSSPGKPEGIPIELMDVIIRILHFSSKYEIDLDAAYKMKMDYNAGRPYRHGDKVL